MKETVDKFSGIEKTVNTAKNHEIATIMKEKCENPTKNAKFRCG